ncbi:MAG: 6-phosphogluconolactonase [Pseudomonadota bacterium]
MTGSDEGAGPPLVIFHNAQEQARRLADIVCMQLRAAITERGQASLALSGGSTPAALYGELCQRDLEWKNIRITLVDERWVAPGEEGSNETFVRGALLRGAAAEAHFVGLWSDAPRPADGLAEAHVRLGAIGEEFDVVVLGMGNDGHTASWFPHAEGLQAALAEDGTRLAAIKARPSIVTGDHLDRMTLTLGAIEKSQFICLLTTGDTKRAAYELARREGPVDDMPVRAILRKRQDLWACWAP